MASMIYGVSQNKKRGIGYDFDEYEQIPSVDDKHKSPFSFHYTHARTQNFTNARKPEVAKNFGRTNHEGPKRFWVPKDKIVYNEDILCSRVKTLIMVPRL